MSQDAMSVCAVMLFGLYLFWNSLNRELQNAAKQRKAHHEQLLRIAAKLDTLGTRISELK